MNFITQFTRYFITGLSGTILDIGSLYVFKDLLGLRAVAAVMINQILIIIYVFTINKYWSFKSNDGATHHQFMRFVLVMGINYIIAVSWIWFWHEILGHNYLIARLINIILSVSWNFLFYKYWVYRVHKSPLT